MFALRNCLKSAVAAGFTVLYAGGALADDVARADADELLLGELGIHLHDERGASVAHVVDMRRQRFLQLDVTGEGVSEKSMQLLEQIDQARARSQKIAAVLAHDLDGDGVVTRAEVEAVLGRMARQPLRSGGAQVMPTPEQTRDILHKLVDKVMEADVDRDGRITADEMRAVAAKELAVAPQFQRSARRQIPLGLDADGDGKVTLAEYEASVRRVLSSIDTDGDGTIGPAEASAAKARIEAARQALSEREQRQREEKESEARIARCKLPRPEKAARMVAIGGYKGQAMSSVSIGGDDQTTMVAQVEIEKGDEPLFIVAGSYQSMVWLVSGAVDRVAGFVASAHPTSGPDKAPRVGVVGLPADKVHTPPGPDCLKYFHSTSDIAGLQALGQLRRHFGVEPVLAVGSYALGKVSVPSGQLDDKARYPNTMILPKVGPSVGMWREALSYNPGGVAMIEPKAVVSKLPVKAYDVLPQQAGLAQLLEDGSLVAARTSRVRRYGTTTIVGDARVEGGGPPSEDDSIGSELRIERKMRFPAGLAGAHSARFILAKGVPVPEGDPGHSTVVSEETGETLPIGIGRIRRF